MAAVSDDDAAAAAAASPWTARCGSGGGYKIPNFDPNAYGCVRIVYATVTCELNGPPRSGLNNDNPS